VRILPFELRRCDEKDYAAPPDLSAGMVGAFVSGSWDKTLRLWDAKSRRPIGEPLRGREREVRSAAFSADGTRIVSGSADNTPPLCDAKLLEDGEELGGVLCQTAHRNLSGDEWKQYVPEGGEYRAVCDHLPLDH